MICSLTNRCYIGERKTAVKMNGKKVRVPGGPVRLFFLFSTVGAQKIFINRRFYASIKKRTCV